MRKSKSKLEKKAGIEPSHTPEEMNDLCKYHTVCREPFCWDKFGRYKSCDRYKNNNPRVRCDEPFLHKYSYE